MMINFPKILKKITNKSFFVFSCILFVVIVLSAIAAYTISAHQINHSFIEQQLSIAAETIRLHLATTVNSELALVLKMADTPVIRQYFMNPKDPVLKALAYTELGLYQEHFENKVLFWVSDADRIFYTTGNEPYIINPDDPESYWYNLTLYETEKFNININYNPDLDQINLWVNVPVFTDDEAKKPIGMLGIGINLTEFSNFVASSYKKFDENITPYLFNKYNEITSAVNYELVQNKVRIDEWLGDAGKELIRVARELNEGETRNFIYGNKIYMVNTIPSMEWYLAVSYPIPGFFALNKSINIVFFSMLFLILFLLIVVNIFIAYSENAIKEQNLQLIEANQKVKSASQAKSDFLAKMSHEIRTPMNAITGMAELLMMLDISREARGYVQDIKQAGVNLLSIINDILDFSKIESGKLDIVPVKYLLSSLINDTVNIIRMRLIVKPLRFYTNIDGNIPNSLIGDEARLRQILLNLLSNAVKYSEKGHIGLSITVDKRDEQKVWLKITVLDTGKGIKPEDQAKLFDEFVQVDTKKNHSIEGTGLGLAITKRLCSVMGGDISMESEYGKGSVFTAIIPQGIESKAPFAAVENAGKKKILVYEGRSIYANAVCWSLENMRVPYTVVTNQEDFAAAIFREEWFYLFSGYGLYQKIKPFMDQSSSAFFGGKKPSLALMVEWGTEAYIPGVRFVSIPVQSLSIANVLNGKAENKGYIKSAGVIRFTYPNARLLVVDDIATNLKVVEGLLAPYRIMIDTCLNGLQAVELVKRNKYDLIFMDHMMPEMDGIEATAIIRSLDGERFRTIPIIALTANAVVGMREMFLENGFDDFLSKPIDVSKMDEMLNRWIPKEKMEKGIDSADKGSVYDIPSIPNVDTVKGIALTGGTVLAYRQVLSQFYKDAQDRLPLLQKKQDSGSLHEFITHVHSLKSASASIGAGEISIEAAELEGAGKAENMVYINEHLPEFAQQLAELIKNIRDSINPAEKENAFANAGQIADISEFIPEFLELNEALKDKKISEIKRLLNTLNQRTQDSKLKEILEQISDQVLMTELDSAIKIIDGLLSGKK